MIRPYPFHIDRLLIILLSGAILLIACAPERKPNDLSGAEEIASPPATRSTVSSTPTTLALSTRDSTESITTKPPTAILSNGSAQTEAALGSYCWHFDEMSTIECNNIFNLSAPTQPLVVLRNQKLTIHLPDKPLMLVTMRVLQWEQIEAEVEVGYTAMALDAPVLASGDLEPQATIEWQAPPMEGEFMLDLMSVYENEGHVGYGWHILVE